MSAGQEAYARLQAAQRLVTAEEWDVITKDRERQVKDARIRSRYPKVV